MSTISNPDPIHHITLLRHAESTGNAENRLQGQSDYPLSEKGCAQAAALAQRWQTEGVTFDQGIVSPLLRARENWARREGCPKTTCAQCAGSHTGCEPRITME